MVGKAQGLMVALVAAAALGLAADSRAQAFVVEGSCRDGQAHGSYELRAAGGQVRVVGAFNRGHRTGSFLFWSGEGRRIAQLPYDDDVLSGTAALWYDPRGRDAEPQPRLEAAYVRSRLSGIKRSWHPNGRLRTELRYSAGDLGEARAFTDAGVPLPEVEARALAARDLATDATTFALLESMVRENLPRCDPASDRLERG